MSNDRSTCCLHPQENVKSFKVLSFIKRKLSRRGGRRETSVQEIHIDPEEDEDRWACRSVSEGGGSGSSSRSGSGGREAGGREAGGRDRGRHSRSNSGGRSLEVVHDMSDEYSPCGPFHVS